VFREAFMIRTQVCPDEVVVISDHEGVRVCAGKLDMSGTRLANAYRARGGTRNSRVTVALPDTMEFIVDRAPDVIYRNETQSYPSPVEDCFYADSGVRAAVVSGSAHGEVAEVADIADTGTHQKALLEFVRPLLRADKVPPRITVTRGALRNSAGEVRSPFRISRPATPNV
jgi:acyl-CoA synthetase (AMP-forming)/AMP-acid ligase II